MVNGLHQLEPYKYNWNILKQNETFFKCKVITTSSQSFNILIVWLV